MKRTVRFYILLVAPAIILYVAMMFVPLILSMTYSFFEWNGIGAKTFVGFDNYIKLFTVSPFAERFFGAFLNTIQFFLTNMIFQNGFALLLAMLISKKLRFSPFFRTLYYLPATISVVISGYIFRFFFNPIWGALNGILRFLGFEKLGNMTWLGNEYTALPCVNITNIWIGVGVPMVLFLSGITAISDEITEAAKIDGCNAWQSFRYVTLPLLKQVLFIVSITTFVNNFNTFELIYTMQGTMAGPNYATDVMGTFFYRMTFGSYNSGLPEMGLGAAIASCIFIVVCFCTVIWYMINSKQEQ